MKNLNKGLIWAFAIVIIVITTISFSCKKSNTTSQEEVYTDEKIISIYSQLGELHNIGLEQIFLELKKQKTDLLNGNNSKINHDKIYKLIDNSVMKFANKSLELKNIDLKLFIKENNSNNPIREYLNKDLVSQIKSLKQAERLSSSFFDLMNQLNSLIDRDASKNEFDLLMRKGIPILTNFDEKSKFVTCISIGFSSLQYWKINTIKWQQLISNEKSIAKNSSSIVPINQTNNSPANGTGTAIGKADITGIISGGIGGCAYGAIGGSTVLPLVGTVTGCAGLGAAGALTVGLSNSAKSAVESFVDWLTK